MEQFPPIAAWSAILAYMSQTAQKATDRDELFTADKGYDGDAGQVRRLEALANHPLAAQSLFEDDSLQSLFQMVADGSLTVFFQGKQGLVLLHSIQLHRHAMQVDTLHVLPSLAVKTELDSNIFRSKS
ncbi:hypothetical protein ACFX13_008343 [Malus domestica]